MFLVEPEEFLSTFVDSFRVNGAKLSIRPGVAKIKRELSGLNLDWHGVRRGRSEVHVGPCLYAKNSEGQDFHSHNHQVGHPQGFGAPGKLLSFVSLPRFENCQMKNANRIC